MSEVAVKLWEPERAEVERTALYRLMQHVNQAHGLSMASYHELWQWSVDHVEDLWGTLWGELGVVASTPYERVLQDAQAPMDSIPRWFPGARLNFAENLLRHPAGDKTAVISVVEGEDVAHKLTFEELRSQVSICAAALRKMGVEVGDRVAGYVPNTTEALIILLAAASIGAVFSSTSPDFGVAAVVERFGQIKPRVLFCSVKQKYRTRKFVLTSKIQEIVESLPSLERVVLYNAVDQDPIRHEDIPKSCTLAQFLEEGLTEAGDIPPLAFEQLPFDHPLYILYSSGTTGKPKCLVHSAGGTLLKHLEEHKLQGDLGPDDVFFFFTTCAWMMYHWLVSGLTTGATIVLFDGSPFHPAPTSLWDLVDAHGITVFGGSAKYFAALEDVECHPRETHSLQSLRAILSTGSPLKDESFDFVYNHIHPDVMLGSISGGTDIIACFMGSNPMLPVYRGQIQARHLGMDVAAFDPEGKAVEGEQGELVCRKPFPSMPVYFLDDEDGAKYKRAYFERFPGVWAHGDFITIHPATKGVVMHGRSDATLNPCGVRFGSAELYHVVEKFEEVHDSLAVGQRIGDDERVILFLMMNPAHPFTEELVNKIKLAIRDRLSPRHVPAIVLETKDIPYTMNGKKVEIAVKKIINGEDGSANRDALANPDSLELYKDIPVLMVDRLIPVPSWSNLSVSSDGSSSKHHQSSSGAAASSSSK